MERQLVQHAGINFRGISAAGLHGVGLRSLPGNAFQLIKGFFQSRRILREFNPDVLLFTGGYVGFPMAVAALRKPKLIFIPDIEPGLVLKALSHVAQIITVVTEETKRYLPSGKRVAVTGYPTRKELEKWSREDACRTFSLSQNKPVLFVFGGSKGARSINQAVASNIVELLEFAQIVHVTGELDWETVQKVKDGLDPLFADDYHITPYLHEEMGAALRAADLVVSRAGASTLGEFPLFGLPAILVPYPYAWRYQKTNAAYLAERGAAIMLEDGSLKDKIVETVRGLICDTSKLQKMKDAMQALAVPAAAATIAALLEEQASKKRNA